MNDACYEQIPGMRGNDEGIFGETFAWASLSGNSLDDSSVGEAAAESAEQPSRKGQIVTMNALAISAAAKSRTRKKKTAQQCLRFTRPYIIIKTHSRSSPLRNFKSESHRKALLHNCFYIGIVTVASFSNADEATLLKPATWSMRRTSRNGKKPGIVIDGNAV